MSECPGITPEQLKTTNGCGSSAWYAWIFRIPQWLSHDLYCKCGCHDLGYQDKTQISWEHKRIKDVALVDSLYDSAYMGPVWQCSIKVVVAEVVWWCLNTWLSKLCYLAAKIGD